MEASAQKAARRSSAGADAIVRPSPRSVRSFVLCRRTLGRSSDLQAAYLLSFPVRVDQCFGELSFLLTAAGQLRILTGFPFSVCSFQEQTTVSRISIGQESVTAT